MQESSPNDQSERRNIFYLILRPCLFDYEEAACSQHNSIRNLQKRWLLQTNEKLHAGGHSPAMFVCNNNNTLLVN